MNASFDHKYPQADETDAQQVLEKNIVNSIVSMTKTMTATIKCVEKLKNYVNYLITDPEIEAHVNNAITPHSLRILQVENLVKITNENMKN